MKVTTDARKGVAILKALVCEWNSGRQLRRRFAGEQAHASGRFKIAVYFVGPEADMYQIRQWYKPLQDLAQKHEVVVLARSAASARVMLEDAAIPVVHLPTILSLENYIETQDIRIVLYVNQNPANFQMFRYGRCWHVFVNHGESDKVYMVSNQVRAYDYAFIAGEAARERLSKALWNYDHRARAIEIGRPQADHFTEDKPFPDDDRAVVLYAPTWEGDRPSMRYGSVQSHGRELVRQVLADPRYRLIYRPHPRSGQVSHKYKAANQAIIKAIKVANDSDPSARHIFDDRPEVGWQLKAADIAILDVSAMVYDRLSTGKPLMVTRPVEEQAEIDLSGYLSECEWLTAESLPDLLNEIERVRLDPESTQRMQAWARRYFGDTTAGAATAKFRTAIEHLLTEWDRRNELDAAEAAE